MRDHIVLLFRRVSSFSVGAGRGGEGVRARPVRQMARRP